MPDRMRPAHTTPSPFAAPKIDRKPWGREVWYAHEDRCAGKILEVTAGHVLSLQKIPSARMNRPWARPRAVRGISRSVRTQ